MTQKIGGQAVINGILYRSKNFISTYIHNKGTIEKRITEYQSLTNNFPYNLPLIRGMIELWEMMTIGMKEMSWSANKSVGEDQTDTVEELFTVIIAIFIGLGIFLVIPWYVAATIQSIWSLPYVIINLIDAAAKIILLIHYIILITQMTDIREAWKYHAAEHKAINCHESDKALTTRNAMKQSPYLSRCSTTFIILVFLFTILFYSFIPETLSFGPNLLLRIALLPIIAGVVYEIITVHQKTNTVITRALLQPGLLFQRLTTKPPKRKHVRLAVKNLQTVLRKEDTTVFSE